MVRRNAFRWTLATLTLLGAKSALADPINFTGDVINDFSLMADNGTIKSTNTSVFVKSVDPDPLNNISQPAFMTSQGIINGWAIRDIALSYDKASDTLYVGLDHYSIAGTATGTGASNLVTALNQAGGVDPANLGAVGSGVSPSDKSITVAFVGTDPTHLTQPGSIVAVAGVPAAKPAAGTPGYGTDNFTVASYNGGATIQNSYGSPLTNHVGSLAFNPDANHPDFEFTVKNFSQLGSTIGPDNTFWVQIYAGSGQDGPVGEESTSLIPITLPQQQNIPEPTTWLAWSLIGGAAVYRLRRGKK